MEEKTLHASRQEKDCPETETATPESADAPHRQEETSKTTPPTGRARIYSHFDKVPLKVLDAIIAVCVAALIAVLILGYLDSHGGF